MPMPLIPMSFDEPAERDSAWRRDFAPEKSRHFRRYDTNPNDNLFNKGLSKVAQQYIKLMYGNEKDKEARKDSAEYKKEIPKNADFNKPEPKKGGSSFNPFESWDAKQKRINEEAKKKRKQNK